jgi:hypothetical protein
VDARDKPGHDDSASFGHQASARFRGVARSTGQAWNKSGHDEIPFQPCFILREAE